MTTWSAYWTHEFLTFVISVSQRRAQVLGTGMAWVYTAFKILTTHRAIFEVLDLFLALPYIFSAVKKWILEGRTTVFVNVNGHSNRKDWKALKVNGELPKDLEKTSKGSYHSKDSWTALVHHHQTGKFVFEISIGLSQGYKKLVQLSR